MWTRDKGIETETKNIYIAVHCVASSYLCIFSFSVLYPTLCRHPSLDIFIWVLVNPSPANVIGYKVLTMLVWCCPLDLFFPFHFFHLNSDLLAHNYCVFTAKHGAECFSCTLAFNPCNNPGRPFSYFTEEETEDDWSSDLVTKSPC